MGPAQRGDGFCKGSTHATGFETAYRSGTLSALPLVDHHHRPGAHPTGAQRDGIVRLVGIAASVAAALCVVFELLVPSSARIIDVAALVFAVATWTVPALIYALIPKAKTSLAAVGRVLGLVVQAACLSVIALWLALVTLMFAAEQHWAWPAILTVVAFWISGAVLLGVGSIVRRRQENARSRS